MKFRSKAPPDNGCKNPPYDVRRFHKPYSHIPLFIIIDLLGTYLVKHTYQHTITAWPITSTKFLSKPWATRFPIMHSISLLRSCKVVLSPSRTKEELEHKIRLISSQVSLPFCIFISFCYAFRLLMYFSIFCTILSSAVCRCWEVDRYAELMCTL